MVTLLRILVGNSTKHSYCMIELESGTSDGIFANVKGKATKEWSRRFEHGFSQLVDWFLALDDQQNTQRFAQDFGHGDCRFHGFLLIGRSPALSEADASRLRWRTRKVVVNSHAISCLTFDDIY